MRSPPKRATSIVNYGPPFLVVVLLAHQHTTTPLIHSFSPLRCLERPVVRPVVVVVVVVVGERPNTVCCCCLRRSLSLSLSLSLGRGGAKKEAAAADSFPPSLLRFEVK